MIVLYLLLIGYLFILVYLLTEGTGVTLPVGWYCYNLLQEQSIAKLLSICHQNPCDALIPRTHLVLLGEQLFHQDIIVVPKT